MSVYKVPQDVEAEDKLVGPFTLKQSIYLVGAALSGWITYVLITSSVPALGIIPMPLLVVFLILGIYRRPDQPVEIYLTSLIRFYMKPRIRIWDRDGLLENVKITAPPKIETNYGDGRTQEQVSSQLQNLAMMMDTRGWASKSASLQLPNNNYGSSDRLVSFQEMPKNIQPTEIHAADDMMDPTNNTNAQYVSQMSDTYHTNYRQNVIDSMQNTAQSYQPTYQPPAQSYDFVEPTQQARQDDHTTTNEERNAADEAFAKELVESQSHQETAASNPIEEAFAEPENQAPDNSHLEQLAQRSDLNVSTLAKQANQMPAQPQHFEDEQEISLR